MASIAAFTTTVARLIAYTVRKVTYIAHSLYKTKNHCRVVTTILGSPCGYYGIIPAEIALPCWGTRKQRHCKDSMRLTEQIMRCCLVAQGCGTVCGAQIVMLKSRCVMIRSWSQANVIKPKSSACVCFWPRPDWQHCIRLSTRWGPCAVWTLLVLPAEVRDYQQRIGLVDGSYATTLMER